MTDDQAEAVLVALADSPAPWARPGVRFAHNAAHPYYLNYSAFEITAVDRAAGTFRHRTIPRPDIGGGESTTNLPLTVLAEHYHPVL